MPKRTLTPDERRLWRLAVHDARPLPGHELPSSPPKPPPLDPQPTPPASPPPPPPTAPRVKPPVEPLRPGMLHNLDHRTADKLRRGRYGIDSRLDLHGMTQAEAHSTLMAVIRRCWLDGRRCLLVITGKGSCGGAGVLRSNVPRWLAEPGLSRMIAAIQPAHPKDGGEGALYILIRRRREGQ